MPGNEPDFLELAREVLANGDWHDHTEVVARQLRKIYLLGREHERQEQELRASTFSS